MGRCEDCSLLKGMSEQISHLVMRSHIESHEPLEENFRGLVVAKEGISVNIVAGLELSNENKLQGTQKKIHQTWLSRQGK